MKKYAKIINEETKQCDVGLGTNTEFYQSIGMTELDVEQAYDGSWYVKGYAPAKPAPTQEEIEQTRIAYRHTEIDNKTLERMRKQANGTWTESDEKEYLELDATVKAYLDEHYPYPVDGSEQ